MHREGINENDVQPEDILCDYCGRASWAKGEPVVEGHQGSIICGSCLEMSYNALVVSSSGQQTEQQCRMCLETRQQPSWHSEFDPQATICLRCTRQSATALEKSKHWDWSRPTGS